MTKLGLNKVGWVLYLLLVSNALYSVWTSGYGFLQLSISTIMVVLVGWMLLVLLTKLLSTGSSEAKGAAEKTAEA